MAQHGIRDCDWREYTKKRVAAKNFWPVLASRSLAIMSPHPLVISNETIGWHNRAVNVPFLRQCFCYVFILFDIFDTFDTFDVLTKIMLSLLDPP